MCCVSLGSETCQDSTHGIGLFVNTSSKLLYKWAMVVSRAAKTSRIRPMETSPSRASPTKFGKLSTYGRDLHCSAPIERYEESVCGPGCAERRRARVQNACPKP